MHWRRSTPRSYGIFGKLREKMIYFDNAATSFYKPAEVMQAAAEAMGGCASASRGAYGPALEADRVLFSLRAELAEMFGADEPECVALTMNATHALNTAIFGIGLSEGDTLLVTQMDHNSVLRPAWRLERQGVNVRVIGLDALGRVDLDEMESVLAGLPEKGKRAVACTHASNLTGVVNDIQRTGEICRQYGASFILDAAQTVGLLPIDMQRDGIDVLCFSGHKALEGPQGTGALIVRKEVKLVPLMEGGSGVQTFLDHMPEEMPARLEAGTQNIPAAAGLLAALRALRGKQSENLQRAENLRNYFLEGIADISQIFEEQNEDSLPITIYGSTRTEPHLPTAAFNIAGEDAGRVADHLWMQEQIAVRAGGHCAPLMHRHYNTENGGSIRVSFSHGNSKEQVDKLLQILRKIV